MELRGEQEWFDINVDGADDSGLNMLSVRLVWTF
jgi:hypothetical protein